MTYFAGTVQWKISGDVETARRELTGLALKWLHHARDAKHLGKFGFFDTGWKHYPQGNLRVISNLGIDTVYMDAVGGEEAVREIKPMQEFAPAFSATDPDGKFGIILADWELNPVEWIEVYTDDTAKNYNGIRFKDWYVVPQVPTIITQPVMRSGETYPKVSTVLSPNPIWEQSVVYYPSLTTPQNEGNPVDIKKWTSISSDTVAILNAEIPIYRDFLQYAWDAYGIYTNYSGTQMGAGYSSYTALAGTMTRAMTGIQGRLTKFSIAIMTDGGYSLLSPYGKDTPTYTTKTNQYVAQYLYSGINELIPRVTYTSTSNDSTTNTYSNIPDDTVFGGEYLQYAVYRMYFLSSFELAKDMEGTIFNPVTEYEKYNSEDGFKKEVGTFVFDYYNLDGIILNKYGSQNVLSLPESFVVPTFMPKTSTNRAFVDSQPGYMYALFRGKSLSSELDKLVTKITAKNEKFAGDYTYKKQMYVVTKGR